MKKLILLLLLFASSSIMAQRTIHLEGLTPETFRKRIKNCVFRTCDSLILEGTISYSDFGKIDYFPMKYLNLKGLSLTDVFPLFIESDTWLHPMLNNNTQQRIDFFISSKRLEEVILPDSVVILCRMAFHGCRNLRKVTLPPNLLVLSDIAFRYCSNLEEVTIPQSVIAIGNYVFGGTQVWNNKKVIKLPPNLEAVGVLHTGNKAKRIEIAQENRFFSSIDGVLYDKSISRLIQVPPRIKHLIIPSTVYVLEEGALTNSSIREIVVPIRVTHIKGGCFAGCPKLKRVTLPNNKSLKLDGHLFNYSDKLHTIICQSDIPYSIDKHTFHKLNKSCQIIVPKGAKAAYEQAEGWKNYRIIEQKR